MTPALMAAYVVTAFALVATPGATTTVVIRQALRAGVRGGSSAAAGAALGNCTHASLAGLGVTVLARRWPPLLFVLGAGGGLYLCWLGLTSIGRGLRGDRSIMPAASPQDSRSSFRAGLTVTLLNPSAVTFYLAVLPSFMPAGSGVGMFAVLALIHITMALACHNLWAVMFSRLSSFFRSAASVRWLDLVTGAALLAFGIWSISRAIR